MLLFAVLRAREAPSLSASVIVGVATGIVLILTGGAIPLWRYVKHHGLVPWRALVGTPADETADGEAIPSLPKQVKDLSHQVTNLTSKVDNITMTMNDMARVTLPNGNGSLVETVHRIESKVASFDERLTRIEHSTGQPNSS